MAVEAMHVDLLTMLQAQEARIADRETLIHEICTKQGIKGFDHSPLERDQVLDFLERLSNMQAKQNDETEDLQVGNVHIEIQHD